MIKFNIDKKRGWDAEKNMMTEDKIRSADCYIFCVYEGQGIQSCNVLNLDNWSFLVVATERLNEVFGNQKSVSLSRLQQFGQAMKYSGLKCAIDLALDMTNNTV